MATPTPSSSSTSLSGAGGADDTATSYDAVLAARYGLDRTPWPTRLFAGAVVVSFLGAVVWAGVQLSQPRLEGNVLAWQAEERQAHVRLEVRGTSATPVTCVVKAQDAQSTDLGYREFTIDQAPVTVDLVLPTLFRASSVSALGCVPAGEPLRVPGPDFPPGVAIP